MRSDSIHIRFFAAALAGLAAAGCGGGGAGSTSPPPGGGVTGNTSIPVSNGVSPGAVSSPPGTVTSVSVPVNGTTQNVGVPGGEDISAGSNVLVLPNTLPVDVDADGANAIARSSGLPMPRTLVPGEIYFRNNGTVTDTGLSLAHHQIVANGNLSLKSFALGYPGAGSTRNITLFVEGPVHVGSGSAILGVSGEVDFSFTLSNGGKLGSGLQNTFPTGALYALPANGTSLYQSILKLRLGGIGAAAVVPATMILTWPNVTKTETRYTNDQTATIWDAGDDIHDVIPGNGIDTVTMSIQAP